LYADGKLPKRYNKHGSVAEHNDKRETRKFGNKEYLLELAFELVDFSWIKATKADGSRLFPKFVSQAFCVLTDIANREWAIVSSMAPNRISIHQWPVSLMLEYLKTETRCDKSYHFRSSSLQHCRSRRNRRS
jgi:hypothetical protein